MALETMSSAPYSLPEMKIGPAHISRQRDISVANPYCAELWLAAVCHDGSYDLNWIAPKVAWSHSSCRIRKLLCPPVFDEFGLGLAA
jgi:hypothetical protein